MSVHQQVYLRDRGASWGGGGGGARGPQYF